MKTAVIVVALIAILCLVQVRGQTCTTAEAAQCSAWSECSRLCDGGVQTRTCPSGTSCDIATACNIDKCVNCSVTGFYMYSGCSKTCGKGTYWMARSILVEPGIGGTPCPQLNYTFPCNTDMCMETLAGKGFYFWGPFRGPGPLTYTVRRIDEDIDVFLFDQENFVQYQYDTNRPMPFETNYYPIASSLDIDTVKSEGPITLDPNTNYYLVVDHTYIGAAQGTNQNGQQVFNENRFMWEILGLEPGPGYNSVPVISAASSTSSLSLVAAVVAAIVAMLF